MKKLATLITLVLITFMASAQHGHGGGYHGGGGFHESHEYHENHGGWGHENHEYHHDVYSPNLFYMPYFYYQPIYRNVWIEEKTEWNGYEYICIPGHWIRVRIN